MPATTLPVIPPQVVRREHVSYSALSLYSMCSLRYYFRYVEGIKESTVSASLVLGSALHAAIEQHFRAYLLGEWAGRDELLDAFWTNWNERDPESIRFNKGEDINSIGRLADSLIGAFQRSDVAKPTGRILMIEDELRGSISAELPDLLARLDLVTDEGDHVEVIDFKSTRAAWSEDQLAGSAQQLHLYHELVKDLSDGKPIRLKFAVMTKTKLPDVHVYDVSSDSRRIQRARRIAVNIWRAIDDGHFYPSPSPMNCATCPYRDACYAWNG